MYFKFIYIPAFYIRECALKLAIFSYSLFTYSSLSLSLSPPPLINYFFVYLVK